VRGDKRGDRLGLLSIAPAVDRLAVIAFRDPVFVRDKDAGIRRHDSEWLAAIVDRHLLEGGCALVPGESGDFDGGKVGRIVADLYRLNRPRRISRRFDEVDEITGLVDGPELLARARERFVDPLRESNRRSTSSVVVRLESM
jgi:hypothetical protein